MSEEVQSQTIQQFMSEPFGNRNVSKSSDYESKYLKCKDNIQFKGFTMIDDSYLLHIVVPSESSDQYYSVVIQFFTTVQKVGASNNLGGYYINFFSNSPGFIYKYAAMYRLYGFLIDALEDKLDAEYKDVLPKTNNTKADMFYDKSIYFACRFLLDKKFLLLTKSGLNTTKKLPAEKLFKGIDDYDGIKLNMELNQIEKNVKSELKIDKENRKKMIHENINALFHPFNHRKVKITANKKIGKKTGVGHVMNKKPKIGKITPKRKR